MDCVEHCEASSAGEYVFSLTTVDIYSGWWEGEGLMGGGQRRAIVGMKNCMERFPINWRELHPDNGKNLLNWHVYAFSQEENIVLSRSRPYHKNDNCFVEQKNRTHVRKQFGYLRFDTFQELEIINDLMRNELRLYKNYFQPVMKLREKIRFKGKFHRKYDKAQTPYQRLMSCDYVDEKTKKMLQNEYKNLNPVELKRNIDQKIKKLYKVHKSKKGKKISDLDENQSIISVSNYLIQQL